MISDYKEDNDNSDMWELKFQDVIFLLSFVLDIPLVERGSKIEMHFL